MEVTKAIITTNPATGLRTRDLVTFAQGVEYDTNDYINKYPMFVDGLLELKLMENSVTKTQIAQAREIYGQKLQVKDCGCSAKSANMLFPMFEEI